VELQNYFIGDAVSGSRYIEADKHLHLWG